MADDDLFDAELAIIEAAEERLEKPFADDADAATFSDLLKNYRKLFRQSRRLVRISDRNEAELASMAESQRRAAEEISQKNAALETLSNKLSKYLSPQVYASIFSGKQEVNLNSQRKKLTVFFMDIADFTETTDRLESEELTSLLNHYLSEMSQVALSYGATIDKYVGDSIMIFFGDPESRGVKEDALECVKMALSMQARLSELALVWRDRGIERPLTSRIGIHTGFCTVGNFGSAERMDYTAIGGTVNAASRLETCAVPGSILISYETYAHVKDHMHCEEAGEVTVKGVAYPIVTYRVLGLAEASSKAETTVNVNLPNLQINADTSRMSDKEREDAARILQETLTRLRPAAADTRPAKKAI